MDLTWSQFRRAHKGQPQSEISELWTQYKEGAYKLKETKGNTEDDPFEDFNEAYNIVYAGKVVSEDELRLAKTALNELMEATSPLMGYTAKATDGWTLWLGPTNNALLENYTQHVAFTITRAWWQMFGTGAIRVDTQVFDEQTQVIKVKEKFQRQKTLFTRYPIPGVEVKFSKNMNDAQIA
jgi:hypothetical protein